MPYPLLVVSSPCSHLIKGDFNPRRKWSFLQSVRIWLYHYEARLILVYFSLFLLYAFFLLLLFNYYYYFILLSFSLSSSFLNLLLFSANIEKYVDNHFGINLIHFFIFISFHYFFFLFSPFSFIFDL